jgi:hypothetical protein
MRLQSLNADTTLSSKRISFLSLPLPSSQPTAQWRYEGNKVGRVSNENFKCLAVLFKARLTQTRTQLTVFQNEISCAQTFNRPVSE